MKQFILILFVTFSGLRSYAGNVVSVRDGDWSDKCTWSSNCNGSVPGSNDNVIINHDVVLDVNLTGGNQIKGTLTITSSGSLTDASGGSAFDMRIHNNGELVIEGDVTIEGDFELQGSSEFTIKSGSSFTVTGNADWSGNTTVTVESGANLTIGGDLDIATGSDNITVDGDVDVGNDFTIGAGAEITGNGTIDIDGAVDNSGDIFGEQGANANCTDCTLPQNPLPVELVFFNVDQSLNSVVLKWVTATEINNEYFEIQRSNNGQDWEVVGQVDGNGTTLSESYYQFIDVNPLNEKVYYRLKQVDFDGRFEYSSIQVSIAKGNSALFEFVFNQGILNLTGTNLSGSDYELTVISLSGQILFNTTVNSLNGQVNTLIDMALPKKEIVIFNIVGADLKMTEKKVLF